MSLALQSVLSRLQCELLHLVNRAAGMPKSPTVSMSQKLLALTDIVNFYLLNITRYCLKDLFKLLRGFSIAEIKEPAHNQNCGHAEACDSCP